MKRLIWLFVIPLFQIITTNCQSQPAVREKIMTGAEQPEQYLHLLKGKRVGLVANNTAIKGSLHLLDFLIREKINVVMVFAPEHGFRGDA
jgi:uncharacterized protein YbbC (DUF1343 family)